MPACTPIGSVVIAAHDEEQTIKRCLESLCRRKDTAPEIVVVCNGCSDRTAEVARATGARLGHSIDVVEIDEANKAHALDVGDAHARSFPRVYLDADVVFDRGGVGDLFIALGGDVLAVAPAMRVDLTGRPWPVRAFYRVWLRRSGVERSLWGSGAYAVSGRGRARFGRFPDLIADDLFVHECFRPDERSVVAACRTVVVAPRTTRGLLRRKVRSTTGSMQLHRTPQAAARRAGERRLAGRRDARLGLAPDVVPYVMISGLARLVAYRRLRRHLPIGWGRDDSR